ncbi:hypothetical protein [Salinarchaeum laminariae]|uniref:hypothetical protein n=1 Tax=Salinarchaeum laminariae TaxID=869888 RepID=UPI0020C0713E|nr:hypothetical protein [Salinarchaeum laminariae]
MLTVPESVLERFRAFSLYNSPYSAHDDGSAIDCYPGPDRSSTATHAPSPVAGTVVAIEQVRAPSKPYAPPHDYLIAIDTGGVVVGPDFRTEDGSAPIARILHVDPTVSVGDRVAAGDDLGDPIRAGFFAPWVGHHLHVGFRHTDDDILRAAGSRPLRPGVDVEPVAWDGTGTVVETGDTYAVLDQPRHPDPGECFAGIGATLELDDGTEESVALDGGLAHYDHGGILPECDRPTGASVSILSEQIGTTTSRSIEWSQPTVSVNGTPIEGLSFAAVRDDLGAKLICPELSLSVGERVRVDVEV